MSKRLFFSKIELTYRDEPIKSEALAEKFRVGGVKFDNDVILVEKSQARLHTVLPFSKPLEERINGYPLIPFEPYNKDSTPAGINRWLILGDDGRWYRCVKRFWFFLDVSLADAIHEKPNEWLVQANNGRWYPITNLRDNIWRMSKKHVVPRHYQSTKLATFPGAALVQNPYETAKMLYGEVNSNWRALTDVRFKLLGLLPAVSVIAWAQLFDVEAFQSRPGALAGFVIGLFGFIISIGILIYDRRNDALYDDLISRGRKLEEELEIGTGIFRGRPRAKSGWINHTTAVNLIYRSVLLGWILVIIWFSLIALRPNWWVNLPAIFN